MFFCVHICIIHSVHVFCLPPQSQGVLSDRLRSFSMHDLSAYQSDPTEVDSGSVPSQSAAGQQRARTMMRSKSESGYTKGETILPHTLTSLTRIQTE
jgi:hypothetical protein